MVNPIVLDISHWQPEPDWYAVKENGTVGVILKATQGTTYVDPTFKDRYVRAKETGLSVSTYHYLIHGSIPAQMQFYLKTLDPAMGERVCIDHEDQACGLDELKQAVQEIMDARPDLQITIYSGHLIKEQLGSKTDQFLAKNTSLWVAHYTTAHSPSWPYATWPAWSLWQYTDSAKVVGIAGNVDGNRWNGNSENLVKWFGPAEEVKPPKPEKKVVVNIQADPGVKVYVQINGEDCVT